MQTARSRVVRLLRANYAYTFFYEFIFGYAIYTAYFSLQGLSAATIGLLMSIWALSIIALELPSGVLSDRFNRRTLLIVAPLIKAGCFACWAMAGDGFWLYAAGFVLWGFSEAVYSGSKEAVLFEHVHHHRYGRVYDKAYGREQAFGEAGGWIGIFLGGFIAYVDLKLALWASVVPLVCAACVALTLPDIRPTPPAKSDQAQPARASNLATFKAAIDDFKANARLRFLSAYIILTATTVWVFEEFDQLYFLAVELPIWAFGVAGAAVAVLRIPLMVHAHRFAKVGGIGWVCPTLAGVLFLIAGAQSALIFIVPLLLVYVVMTPVEVIGRAKFQKAMEGTSRATTTSVLSLGIEVLSAVLLLAVGVLIEAAGVFTAFQVGGVCLVLVGTWAFWRDRRGQTLSDGDG